MREGIWESHATFAIASNVDSSLQNQLARLVRSKPWQRRAGLILWHWVFVVAGHATSPWLAVLIVQVATRELSRDMHQPERLMKALNPLGSPAVQATGCIRLRGLEHRAPTQSEMQDKSVFQTYLQWVEDSRPWTWCTECRGLTLTPERPSFIVDPAHSLTRLNRFRLMPFTLDLVVTQHHCKFM